jgi:hypothetical protein
MRWRILESIESVCFPIRLVTELRVRSPVKGEASRDQIGAKGEGGTARRVGTATRVSARIRRRAEPKTGLSPTGFPHGESRVRKILIYHDLFGGEGGIRTAAGCWKQRT